MELEKTVHGKKCSKEKALFLKTRIFKEERKKIRNSKTFLFSGKPARQKFQLTFAGKSYKIGVKSKRQVVNAR